MGRITDLWNQLNTQLTELDALRAQIAASGDSPEIWAIKNEFTASNLMLGVENACGILRRMESALTLLPDPDDPDIKVTRNKILNVHLALDFEDIGEYWTRMHKAGIHAGFAQWLNGFITALMLLRP